MALDPAIKSILFPDSAENDVNLFKHFISTGSFRKVRSQEKLIVVGRKGSGKSAIYRYLKDNAETHYIKLTPDQFSLELFNHFLKNFEGNQFFGVTGFAAAWKLVILYEISCDLTSRNRSTSTNIVSTSVALLQSWTQSNVNFGTVHAIASDGLSNIRAHNINNPEFPIDLDLIGNYLSSRKIHVLIDDLDYVWQNSTLGATYIYGLITAGLSLSQERNLFVTLFLREDMFRSIERQFHRIDNMRQMIEQIDWNPQLLKNMISKRIQTYFGTTQDGWELLFPSKVREYDSFKYMVERTQLRPREILQYCGISYETAAAYKKSKIEGPDIEQAERIYSAWKLGDLCSEYSSRYNNLSTLFESFSVAKIRLSKGEVLSIISDILHRGLISRYFSDDTTPITEEEILKFLYECGFLRARVQEDGRDRFKASSSVPLLNLSFVEFFDIHPAYRRILNGR